MDNSQPISSGNSSAGLPPKPNTPSPLPQVPQNFAAGQAPKPFTQPSPSFPPAPPSRGGAAPSTGLTSSPLTSSGQAPSAGLGQTPKPFTPPQAPSSPSPFASPSSLPPRVSPAPPPNIPTSDSAGRFNATLPPKVEARTMASDIKSVGEMGGSAPRPYVPPQVPGLMQTSSQISGQAPLAKPGQGPEIRPMTDAGPVPPLRPPMPPSGDGKSSQAPSPMGAPVKKPSKGSKKGIFTLILSFVIIVGAGVIGYFFVFPLFRGEAPSSVDTPPPPPPTEQLSEEAGLFGVPPEGFSIPPASDSIQAPKNEQAPVSPAAPLTHASYLTTSPQLTSTVALENVAASSLREKIGFQTAQVSSLKEIVLTRNGSSLELAELGAGLLPQFFTDEITALFQPDFTYALYTDSKGAWPVYIFRLNSSALLSSAKAKIASIEQVSVDALHNLYLSSPGGGGVWKDGQVLGNPGRYLTFTQSGASLNYIWIDAYLLFGTSYTATQETVKLLGS